MVDGQLGKGLGPGPHFFCIGPGKSATTWVADHLKLHRDVWLPPIQELGYLNAGFERFRDTEHVRLQWDWWNVAKRIVRNKSLSPRRDAQFFEAARDLAQVPNSERDLKLYRELFAPARGKITGDITPNYADLSVEQIRSFAPVLDGTQIFMIARDPVQKFWSAMSMYYRYRIFGNGDYGSLEMAKFLFEHPEQQKQHFLTRVVERWRSGIGEDRLKIFFFDDVVAEPVRTFKEIVAFIGADYRKRIPIVSPAYNRQCGSKKIEISPDAREWVRQSFQPELEACAGLFGRYGEKWLKRHRQPYPASAASSDFV